MLGLLVSLPGTAPAQTNSTVSVRLVDTRSTGSSQAGDTFSAPREYAQKTLRSFIRAKFGDRYAQDVAYLVIGREPSGRVPWLGNWAAERVVSYLREDAKLQVLAERLARECLIRHRSISSTPWRRLQRYTI